MARLMKRIEKWGTVFSLSSPPSFLLLPFFLSYVLGGDRENVKDWAHVFVKELRWVTIGEQARPILLFSCSCVWWAWCTNGDLSSFPFWVLSHTNSWECCAYEFGRGLRKDKEMSVYWTVHNDLFLVSEWLTVQSRDISLWSGRSF